MIVLPKRFYLIGHTTVFRPETQQLEPHYQTPLLTMGVKGLRKKNPFDVAGLNNSFYFTHTL